MADSPKISRHRKSAGLVYERQIPKFLQPYAHMLQKPSYNEQDELNGDISRAKEEAIKKIFEEKEEEELEVIDSLFCCFVSTKE